MNDTLVLFNNTLVSGNHLAANSQGPDAVAYDRAKGELFVANQGTPTVSVLSSTPDKVVDTISLPAPASSVAYDSGRGEIFVAEGYGVAVINDSNDSITRTIPYSVAGKLAYDPAKGEVFLTRADGAEVSVINDTNDSVVAYIATGSSSIEETEGLAYDSGRGEVFVATADFAQIPYTGYVNVVNDTTDSVVATLGVGSFPVGVGYDSAKGEVFVANSYSDNLSIIDDATNKVSGTVALPAPASAVTYAPGTGKVFVASSNITVLNDTTESVVANITTGFDPYGLAYTPDLSELFVTNYRSDSVSAVDASTNAVLTTVPIGGADPSALAFDAGTGEVFVTDTLANNVTVVDSSSESIVDTIPVGVEPVAVVYDSGRHEVFVANNDCIGGYPICNQGTISVISDSSDRVVATVVVGLAPSGVAYDPAKGEVFVACNGNVVSVIDDTSDTVVANVSARGASAIAYDSGMGEIFVSEVNGSAVGVINDTSDSLVANVSVPDSPSSLAYDGPRGEVFVADYPSTSSQVINDSSNRVVANLSVRGTFNAEYVGGTGEVFLDAVGSNNLSVVDEQNDSVVETILAGGNPGAIGYDAWNGLVYVCNPGQGSLSILARARATPTYPVSFAETGLPSGASWSVSLNGSVGTTEGSEILFNEPNGTYPFSVASPSGFAASPSSGTVPVEGSAVSVSIIFVQSPPPIVVSFSYPEPASCGGPVNVTFTSEVSGGTPPYQYLWSFGDGAASSSLPDPTHEYASNAYGSIISLNVTDSAGATGNHTDRLVILIASCPPPYQNPGVTSSNSAPWILYATIAGGAVIVVAIAAVLIGRSRRPR